MTPARILPATPRRGRLTPLCGLCALPTCPAPPLPGRRARPGHVTTASAASPGCSSSKAAPTGGLLSPRFHPQYCTALLQVAGRQSACIFVLARNDDVGQLSEAIASFERAFNARFRYPYLMVSDVPFDDFFVRGVKEAIARARGIGTGELNRTEVEFGVVPKEHWEMPEFIDKEAAEEWRTMMGPAGADVPYGSSRSYHKMCRYQSGFFFRHPLALKYRYYWRLEPEAKFFCRIDYDVFGFMAGNGIKYGFSIMMSEFEATVPSLWPLTFLYAKQHRINSTLLRFFGDPFKIEHNDCYFWSNFEIGNMSFFRSPAYLSYFDHLDRSGGFFLERWGDAPVHTLGAALFLSKTEVHWFEDIGYEHSGKATCPVDDEDRG
ncbi:hypothetical protein DFJ74DRAFT_608939 [Hyaloraphidium curvatum]|nr:hypothetical protein DFJ74DRAFT_608939 [Hyaloraphidium curvatum]